MNRQSDRPESSPEVSGHTIDFKRHSRPARTLCEASQLTLSWFGELMIYLKDDFRRLLDHFKWMWYQIQTLASLLEPNNSYACNLNPVGPVAFSIDDRRRSRHANS
ncbi:hypothetical protein Scep_025970 [Stephania cephalantha]|uniref:Uncharacterized protein n=1 Tax=Stephania cephalantha TaxID=152367 RepID=A0AAP0HS22_9MAGN